MNCGDILPLKNQEIKVVDITTLKNKIISTDLVLKKFQEREAECNQLKTLKKRLESDCTTYERELKQVLGELLPTKKSLEEFKKTTSDQNLRIKELEDELKASCVISEQFRELVKEKETQAEEYKVLATVEKDLKKKEKQLDKSKESNQKLHEKAKKNEQKIKKLRNSYTKAVSVVEKLSEKLKSKNSLNRREIKEITALTNFLAVSKDSDEEDEDNDALALERLLQDGNNEQEIINKETEMINNDLSETEDFPGESPKKIKMVTSKSENAMETPSKKNESEEVLEHHSYSLSPLLEKRKRKASPSPKKLINVETNHLCGINEVKKSPVVIMDNGVCDSVTILNEEDPLSESKCETILNYCKETEPKFDYASIDKSIRPVTLLDPNKTCSPRGVKGEVLEELPAKVLDCEMKDLTEVKASNTVSTSEDGKCDANKLISLNNVPDLKVIDPEIYDVVEYLVTMACSIESVEIVSNIVCDESPIMQAIDDPPSSQTSQSESLNKDEIEDKAEERITEMESHCTVIVSKRVQESTLVNVKVVEDEFKTTLRRLKRLTRRISSCASFERPLTPIPPSPPPISPIDDLEMNFSNEEEPQENLDILPREKLDDLFGTDSEDDADSLGSFLPPKPFQHQESQGFESELVPEEYSPNSLVKTSRRPSLQNPPCSALASRRLSTQNLLVNSHVSPPRNSSRQCPSSIVTTTSENNSLTQPNPENGRNNFVPNRETAIASNAVVNSNFTEPTRNPPFNSFIQTLRQPKEFNPKLKANFSHNASTGSYSISIRLPDSTDPVKNMHFEIDTITNEFSLNFGPGTLQPCENNNCATSSTEKSNHSFVKDSCYESAYDSGLNAEGNESRCNNNNFNKNDSIKRSSSQISPITPHELSSKKSKDCSQRSSLTKNSTPAATNVKPPSQKFAPCNNSFLKPRKSLEAPDRLRTISSLPKRPFLKNDSKSRNVSDNALSPSTSSSKELEDVSSTPEPIMLKDKMTDRGSKLVTVNKDAPKPQSKTKKQPSENPAIPDQEIPVLQPTLPKRISHCAKNEGKEVSTLPKKTETSPSKMPSTQKRKLSSEFNEKESLSDVEQAAKKICTKRYDNKELTRIRKFCKSTTKMFNKNEGIDSILQEMYKLDNTNDKTRKNTAQNIYLKLSNQKVVPNPKTFIDAILMFSSKVKKNPFIPTKKDYKFVSPFETGVTIFLHHLANEVESFKNIAKDFKDQALFFLFSNRKLTLNGSACVCRILTIMCMRDCDFQMVRMICFNLLKEHPKTALYLVANVITIWPQILAPNKIERGILRDTFFKVLLNTETELNSTLKKYAMKPIRKFCEVNCDNCKLNVDEIVKECVKHFLDKDATVSLLAETSQALEIVASHQSWDWRLKQLMFIELLPLIEKNTLPNTNLVELLKFLGIILNNYPSKLKKDVSTIMKLFLQLLTDEKTPEEIRETALFNILHLKDLLDNPQLDIVTFWIKNHRDTLKPKFLINKISVI